MKSARGFTLVELLLVFALFALMYGIVSLTLLRPQQKFNIDTTVATLITDIKEQQLKAMLGDSDGLSASQDFGIRFENSPQNRYILFHGSTYNAADSTNFVINLPTQVSLSGSLPLQVIFQRRSGEITAQSSFTIQNNSGDAKTLTINKLGGISVN